jgi:glycosyltransferase involved in cell wall biosynthesis
MQVTLSVGGRFQAFYLAKGLSGRGYLKRLITSYPRFEAAKYDIPKERVRSVIIKELLGRGWNMMPRAVKKIYNPQSLIHDIFDRRAASLLEKSDLCVAWSGVGLYTIRKAKEMGAVTVIDEGSSHILFHQDILREEYEKLGVTPLLSHPKIVEKELAEYKEADYIAVPSLFVKKTFLERGFSEERLIHVPYGASPDEFRKAPKEDSVFRVVYVGNMSVRKGVHYLLEAFSELNLPNSELLLIGSMSDEMKPFFAKHKGGYTWKGPVPQKDLYRHYSRGSVFVLMSLEEGMAYVLPQAMACGLAVICTTNTGGGDIVRDGVDGFIIPIRDKDALKMKLTYLYENPGVREAMGDSAMARVKEDFSWDRYSHRMIMEYERITAG